MGGCLSSSGSEYQIPTAKVVSINGDLHEYNVPVYVWQVLQSESSSSSLFLCNSDELYYDDNITAMGSEDKLQTNQIYFLLHKSKLQYPLGASDMAALAVKASKALQSSSNLSFKGKHRRNSNRISPVLLVNHQNIPNKKPSEKQQQHVQLSSTTDVSRSAGSGSVRRLRKSASRRAKLAVRSFRRSLSTIHEGTVVV